MRKSRKQLIREAKEWERLLEEAKSDAAYWRSMYETGTGRIVWEAEQHHQANAVWSTTVNTVTTERRHRVMSRPNNLTS